MDHMKGAFLALVAVSTLMGGYTVVDFGDRLRTLDNLGDVKPQVSVDVTGTDFDGDRLAVSFRLSNPSKFDLQLRGASLRVYNQSSAKLAAGAGRRIDDGPSVIPAGGTTTATYEIRLSDSQRRAAAGALGRDAKVGVNFAIGLDEQTFTLVATDLGNGEGGE